MLSPSLLLYLLILPCVLFHSSTIGTSSPEAPAKRNYFYFGGHYENVTQPLFGLDLVKVDQIYVEELIPFHGVKHKYPVVFLAGGGQTGTNFLNTPDGREGLASYFLRHGYVVYLTDQPQRGRSPWLPGRDTLQTPPVNYVEKFFTAGQYFKLWPQAIFHTQWPGSGLFGDPIFDAFFASQVQFQANPSLSELNNRVAGAALLDQIGPAFLITHSQAGPYGWGIGDLRPALVKGILAIEPEGPPFVDEITGSGPARPYGISTLPLTYSPTVVNPVTDLIKVTVPSAAVNLSACIQQGAPTRKLVHLSRLPVLIVTGEASYHAPYDYCTAKYLRQAGVDTQWLNLPAIGIRGNAHFSFLEKNNQLIFAALEKWVEIAERTGKSTLAVQNKT